jgi:hypothetical protein
MKPTPDWRIEAELELLRAEAARQAGNEGRARVCARRAAGLAARDFLDRRGLPPGSAYRSLLILADLPDLSPDLRAAARRLTLQVNEEFTLPQDVDLIAEARRLCSRLPAE